MRIAIVTAGAAGMYCGSCLRDNALARALLKLGHDAQLIPLYTPIRTDVPDASSHPIFLGGINAFLRQKYRLVRAIPAALTRWLDHPWLINRLAARAVETDASELAALTLTVLQAERGLLRSEFDRLAAWLTQLQPDIVHFSNIMIAGAARSVRERTGATVVVSLQGDDIFLDGLPEEHRDSIISEVAEFEHAIAAYVTHSNFYANKMSAYLNLPLSKFQVRSLATELEDLSQVKVRQRETKRVGYLARMAPEKGLHMLCEAFLKLRMLPNMGDAELHIAGYEGRQHAAYINECLAPVRATAPESFRMWPTVDRGQKTEFLQHIDVISVPSPYEEPKGLYVLESLAAGVPFVQPAHGAFPELLAATGGGLLFEPNSVSSLLDKLVTLLENPEMRMSLGETGRDAVLENHTSESEAAAMISLYQQLIGCQA